MLPTHRLDAPGIKLRLYGHVPTTAGRADEALTGRRDGCVHRKAEPGWRNIALTTTGIAVHPRKLAVAVEVGECDRLGSVGHHAAPNQSDMCHSLGRREIKSMSLASSRRRGEEMAQVEGATRPGPDLTVSALERAGGRRVRSTETAVRQRLHLTTSQILPRGGRDRDRTTPQRSANFRRLVLGA